jgi:Transcription factor IIIC subunit delta N-term
MGSTKYETPVASLAVLNKPLFSSAIAWSEDNVIAVAMGAEVVLLDPSNLAGPRAFIALGQVDHKALRVDAAPRNGAENIHAHLAFLRETLPTSQQHSSVRSISWSPAGCSSFGGCLLATVTDDHQAIGFPSLRASRCCLAHSPASASLRLRRREASEQSWGGCRCRYSCMAPAGPSPASGTRSRTSQHLLGAT